VGYALIPLVVSLVLGVRYVAIEQASRGSKLAVAVTVAAGLIIWWRYPQWILVATLLQVAVCIYVLVYLKLNPLNGRGKRGARE